ncbi:MAG: DUF933 domain-containing protein, partial [Candidatus Binatia bacterium]
TYATVTFVDVQGETAAAEKSALLSAPLVAELRDADAIVAVLRGFPDPFSAAPADPVREFGRFEEELVLADLAVVERRLERLRREGAKGREPDLLARLEEWLGEGKPLRRAEISPDERRLLSGYQLISAAPLLAVLNLPEDAPAAVVPKALSDAVAADGGECLALAATLEREIAELPAEDQAAFLRDAGVEASARDRFVRTAYRVLDLVSFLTTGEDEVRAWTIRRGTAAQRAAGKIHSDIEKGFIRAEVIAYEDFVRLGGEAECKKAGKARLEGKDYVVADGDIIHFRFNV